MRKVLLLICCLCCFFVGHRSVLANWESFYYRPNSNWTNRDLKFALEYLDQEIHFGEFDTFAIWLDQVLDLPSLPDNFLKLFFAYALQFDISEGQPMDPNLRDMALSKIESMHSHMLAIFAQHIKEDVYGLTGYKHMFLMLFALEVAFTALEKPRSIVITRLWRPHKVEIEVKGRYFTKRFLRKIMRNLFRRLTVIKHLSFTRAAAGALLALDRTDHLWTKEFPPKALRRDMIHWLLRTYYDEIDWEKFYDLYAHSEVGHMYPWLEVVHTASRFKVKRPFWRSFLEGIFIVPFDPGATNLCQHKNNKH